MYWVIYVYVQSFTKLRIHLSSTRIVWTHTSIHMVVCRRELYYTTIFQSSYVYRKGKNGIARQKWVCVNFLFITMNLKHETVSVFQVVHNNFSSHFVLCHRLTCIVYTCDLLQFNSSNWKKLLQKMYAYYQLTGRKNLLGE